MNKNKDFIQLPPLPADMDGDAVSILWEYAKMPDEERKHYQGILRHGKTEGW